MKNKFSLFVFLFVLGSVGFFIFKAISFEGGPSSTDSDQSLISLDHLKDKGLENLDVKYLDGRSFDLQSITSPLVILNFWASWCGPCVDEIPSFIKLIEAYNGQITLLAVSVDSDLNQMNQFLKGFNISNKNIHILIDPEFIVAQKLGTFKLPESYIFSQDRRLVRKVSGSIHWMDADVKSFINKVLNPKL